MSDALRSLLSSGLVDLDRLVREATYGGNITLDTALGRGTRLRLWFPSAAT